MTVMVMLMMLVRVVMTMVFQVKDYLGRKEMHVLAKKTGLTVNQV